MIDHTHAGDKWVPEVDYQFICSKVPILCVDLLPLMNTRNTFGLIERDTPTGHRGLNLIGGGVLIDEPIQEALKRHLLATLGDNVTLSTESVALIGVYQYFREQRPGQLHDPRKNAVSLTYIGIVEGDAIPSGEAHALHLFNVESPPSFDRFGFGQGPVVYDGLTLLRQAQKSG